MTKAFLHGRTEAIRTVQPESVAFVKVRGTHAGQTYLVRLTCLFA
jgi:carnitine O-acetyltransferase